MAERDLAEQAAQGVEDPAAFKEACAVFGNAGALAHLQTFRADLRTCLSRIGRGPTDTPSLREMAHRTAGRAGLLGFPALADASAHLEETIRTNAGVSIALDRWTRHAQAAAQGHADADKDEPPPEP